MITLSFEIYRHSISKHDKIYMHETRKKSNVAVIDSMVIKEQYTMHH